MKKFLAAVLAAGIFLSLPLDASAQEGDSGLPVASDLSENAAPEGETPSLMEEDVLDSLADSDSPGDDSGITANPSPTPGPDATPEPDPAPTPVPGPDPSPAPSPITPGLETTEHPAYITGNKDMANPEGRLTRAEAASMIYSLLESEPIPDPETQIAYSDVKESDWFAEKVLALSQIGALNGYADGTFRPGKNISRAEFVVILSRFFPLDDSADTIFTDVDPESYPWAYRQIAQAADKGWIEGFAGGVFKPDDPVTRAQAIKIINRALGRSPDKAKIDADGKVLLFLDLPYTHWAYYEIMEAALPHSPMTEDADAESWLSYTVPAASRAPGYHSIGGELYKVDSAGHWVRNATDGVLKFDNNGRYTTGNASLDSQLTAFVKANTVSGDSNYNNYRRLHNKVASLPYRAGSYLGKGLEDGQTGWEAAMALDMLKNSKGNCYRYAGLGTMLARKMGYQATGISGKVDIGYGYVLHGWVEIKLDGETLFCDPQQQNRFPKENLYMSQYSQFTKRHYSVKGVQKK